MPKTIISLDPEQERKLEMKQLRKRIREKQIELVNYKVIISARIK